MEQIGVHILYKRPVWAVLSEASLAKRQAVLQRGAQAYLREVAVQLAMEQDVFTDEINSPLSRR